MEELDLPEKQEKKKRGFWRSALRGFFILCGIVVGGFALAALIEDWSWLMNRSSASRIFENMLEFGIYATFYTIICSPLYWIVALIVWLSIRGYNARHCATCFGDMVPKISVAIVPLISVAIVPL